MIHTVVAGNLVGVSTSAGPADTDPDAGTYNEPANYTEIFDVDWSVKEPTGWTDYTNPNNLKCALVTDQTTAPLSPNTALQWKYVVGTVPPNTTLNLGAIRTTSSSFNKQGIYIRFSIKFSTNFRNHEGGVGKLNWLLDNGTGGGGDPYFFRSKAFSDFDPTGNFYMSGFVQNGSSPPNRSFDHNLKGSNEVVTRGQWYTVETQMVMNSDSSTADGEFHMWIDGDKKSEYTNVWYSDAAVPAWDFFKWNPLWGGQEDSVPEEFYVYVDHTYISGI